MFDCIFIYFFIYIFIHFLVCVFIYLFIFLFIYLFVFLFIYLSIHSFIHSLIPLFEVGKDQTARTLIKTKCKNKNDKKNLVIFLVAHLIDNGMFIVPYSQCGILSHGFPVSGKFVPNGLIRFFSFFSHSSHLLLQKVWVLLYLR